MKKSLLLLLVALLAFSVAAIAQNKDKKVEAKEATIKGEVVDVACYLAKGAKGEGHIGCATACAKGGGTLGVLAADGKLYVSLLPDDHSKDPNAALMDHIGHTVEAKGFVRSKGGVNGIMIKSIAMAK